MVVASAERPTEILYKPHPGPQDEFHHRREDIVLFGGSKGPGKSKALESEALRQIENPNYKGLILRRTYPQLQELIDRAKVTYTRQGGVWKENLHRFEFPSGAKIVFGHCQHEGDKENYQGHEYQFIGIDQLEQFTETMFNFFLAQNRTSDGTLKCYVRATANPGGVGHWWIKRRFIDGKKPYVTHHVEYTMKDGRRMTRSSCYIPATVYDNPTLLKAQPNYLATLMDLPEIERRAYLDGDWNAFTTQCVFDRDGMAAQATMVEAPQWVGLLRDSGYAPEFVLDEKGQLKIWRQPVERRQYFIAADVAKGVEGGDYSCAGVFDRHSWDLVAKWYGRLDPMEFGKVLYGLGLYYNKAKIAVEVWPGPGIATGSKLVEMQYPNLYRHLKWDGEKHADTTEIGWVTDQRSRFEMLATLQDVVRRKAGILRDQDILDEMFNFIRHENGRMSARESCHDDQVVVCAMAYQCMTHDPVAEILDEDRQNVNAPVVTTSLVRAMPSGRKAGPMWRKAHGF